MLASIFIRKMRHVKYAVASCRMGRGTASCISKWPANIDRAEGICTDIGGYGVAIRGDAHLCEEVRANHGGVGDTAVSRRDRSSRLYPTKASLHISVEKLLSGHRSFPLTLQRLQHLAQRRGAIALKWLLNRTLDALERGASRKWLLKIPMHTMER